MTREAEVVAPDIGNVDREVRYRLGAVDQEPHTPVVADPGNLADGEDGAENVRGVGYGDEPGLVADSRLQVREVETTVRIRPDDIHRDPPLTEPEPGEEV